MKNDEHENISPADSDSGQRFRRQRPTKPLPTDRIVVEKQIDIIRAYAIASGTEHKPVSNADIAEVVQLKPSTIGLTNAFFTDTGFLTRVDKGFVPSSEVFDFARTYQWDAEGAVAKLSPIVARSWYAQRLLPKLRFRSMSQGEALIDLADESSAGTEYRPQLCTCLEYMQAVKLIDVQDNTITPSAIASALDHPGISAPGTEKEQPPKAYPTVVPIPSPPAPERAKPGIDFQVSVHASMDELATWEPARITAFFNGIAQALAAKKGTDSP